MSIEERRIINQKQQVKNKKPIHQQRYTLDSHDPVTGKHKAVGADGSVIYGDKKYNSQGEIKNTTVSPDGNVTFEGQTSDKVVRPNSEVGYIRGQIFGTPTVETWLYKKIKYVYSVLESGVYNFYVGGWRKKPIKVFGLTPEQYSYIGYCSIDNLGGDNYSINISYQDKVQYWKNGKLEWGVAVSPQLIDPGTGYSNYSPSGHGVWFGVDYITSTNYYQIVDGVETFLWNYDQGSSVYSDPPIPSQPLALYPARCNGSGGTRLNRSINNSKFPIFPSSGFIYYENNSTNEIQSVPDYLSSPPYTNGISYLCTYNSRQIITNRIKREYNLQLNKISESHKYSVGWYRDYNYIQNDTYNTGGTPSSTYSGSAYAALVWIEKSDSGIVKTEYKKTPFNLVPGGWDETPANFIYNFFGTDTYFLNSVFDDGFTLMKNILTPSEAITQSKNLSQYSVKNFDKTFTQQGDAQTIEAYLPHVETGFSIISTSYHP